MASVRVLVSSDADVVSARQQGRVLAAKLGLAGTDLTRIATAISEVARNIVLYGVRGEIIFDIVEEKNRQGLLVVARDEGPGIPDLALAMRDGYTTGKGLGLGLPGAKRLMDEFEIVSEVGKGTVITMKKWRRADGGPR